MFSMWRYRQALRNFIVRNLTVRYKRSFLGFVWSLINPMLLILTFIVVFKYLWPNPEKNYSVKLVTTILAWRFFNSAVMDMSASVSTRLGLIKRVAFPRIILPVSSLAANFIDYILSLSILIVMFAAVRLTVAWDLVWLAVMAMVIQIVFTFGFSLILATLSVYYTDVQFLVGNLFQMWFFLTPVIYPPSTVVHRDLPQIYKTLYFSNPMAPLMAAYRGILPEQNPFLIIPHYSQYLMTSAAVACGAFILGLWLFKRLEPGFAKEV